MIDNLFDDYGQLFTGANVSFFYSGYVSQPLLTAMVEGFKVKLEKEGVSSQARRRLLSSLVEMTQNIIHYAIDTLTPNDQDDHQLRWGSICVTLTEGHYVLECANRVEAAQAQLLQSRIEPLKLLTQAEIKERYARAIREEAPEGSRGAGLGILTVARDAAAPLEYSLKDDPNRPGTCIFVLKATI
jgi:hypothetical protein